MNIEKDWKLIGTDATYSERLLMDFAEDINEFGDKNSIRKYYIEKAGEIQIDIFNHIVTLLTMCVNKELRIALDNIEDNIQPEMFPQIISSIHKEISDAYIMDFRLVFFYDLADQIGSFVCLPIRAGDED